MKWHDRVSLEKIMRYQFKIIETFTEYIIQTSSCSLSNKEIKSNI